MNKVALAVKQVLADIFKILSRQMYITLFKQVKTALILRIPSFVTHLNLYYLSNHFQRYQKFLDDVVPFLVPRWLFVSGIIFYFIYRIIALEVSDCW